MDKVLTAPLAIIKVAGKPIGKMKNIRVSESFQRQKVVGIGQLFADESATTSWQGTLSCSFFNINFKISQIPNAIRRDVQTIEDFTNYLIFQEVGVQVDIMRKVKTGFDAKGIPIVKLEIYASIPNLFLNRENFDISDGQISGRDAEFEYLSPITFPE
jgi:hypothetical protein